VTSSCEIAPEACIVCAKPAPIADKAAGQGWRYLAGAKPLGSLACSQRCQDVAIRRFYKTGRCDLKGV
jgi:hypothetical protein